MCEYVCETGIWWGENTRDRGRGYGNVEREENGPRNWVLTSD